MIHQSHFWLYSQTEKQQQQQQRNIKKTSALSCLLSIKSTYGNNLSVRRWIKKDLIHTHWSIIQP